MQVVLKKYKPDWTYIKCDYDSLRETVTKYLTTDKANTFHLGEPTLRFSIVETGQKYRLLLVNWHHAILDATSWELVQQDFHDVYHGEPRVSLYPFAKFVEEIYSKTSDDVAKEKYYWLNKFAQLSRAFIPRLGAPQESGPTRNQIARSIQLPVERISQCAQQLHVTAFTLIKAAWAILLREYTQSNDVVFGYVLNGRNGDLEGVSTIVGPCINTLPSRTLCDNQTTIAELLLQIHESYTFALSYQQSSLRDIQEWVGVSPLFDSIINYRVNSSTQKEHSKTPKDKIDDEGEFKLVPIQGNEATEVSHGVVFYENICITL
ncbi:hypothetical protein K7432_018322 [Basidiobolus ranarum]|uniref:Condensation domain-containing protein n=1 Tax=Basidiobolus ranarum TaxID=34480 RepID=A0ABR2WCC2_9FUNG